MTADPSPDTGSEPRTEAVGLPTRNDLADTLCFIRRHDDHPEERHCAPSWSEADSIVRCLAALNDSRRNRLPAADRAEPVGLDVERLREAARRAGLPREVSVADIENLAAEYTRLAEAPDGR